MVSATYLYCVVHMATRPRASRVPPGLAGATRATVRPVAKSLWVVAAEVPLEFYGPDRLEAGLRDLRWVGDVALAHEAVVEHFARMRGATVIPMKLFTMFSTEARAIEQIASSRRGLAAVVRRIAGSEEWAIRVVRAGGPRAKAPASEEAARSGAAFLAAKKQARDAAKESAVKAAAAAEAAYEALVPIAKAVRRRTDAPEGATSPPLLDAAFLVPAGRRTRFRTTAGRLAADCARAGALMTLTGPWPAYNFVHPDEAGE